ncbi:MAG: PD-(D/E)XK nuclease family protein [Candidatus Omnitrophica bacterium]|nr:PD-(D/E)XK nuclease family protein [Candidatus Omnitrophota bacterium]
MAVPIEVLKMNAVKLSPSTLNLFLECPRCFWLDKVKNVRRPRGIFPSLPGGMDRVIKAHFDTFRTKSVLPPELDGDHFEGVKLFEDQDRLERWRSWKTGLVYRDGDGSILSGAIDDLLVKGDRYLPFDYKTKGSVTTEADAVKYYQNQLNCYALLLEENQMPTTGFGFLLYYSPKSVGEKGRVLFELQAIRIPTDPEKAREIFRKAVALLNGPLPASGAACEHCAWLGRFRN